MIKKIDITYNGNNIVNLISSIMSYCGLESKYKNLDLLSSDELNKFNNVVLFLVDGLGYKWLEKYAKNSFLYSKLFGNMQTIFPSSTSSVVSTFSTGYTTSEHCIMGGNMYCKEVGSIIQILSWKHKILDINLGEKIDILDLIEKQNFYKGSNKDVFIVTDNIIKNSFYNKLYNKDSKILSYNDLTECFSKTIDAVNYNNNKKYIYSYWSNFDTISHKYGIDSNELLNHFLDIDYQFMKLEKALLNTNSLVIVSADHGQLNSTKHINLKIDYPEIYNMLSLPLAGEGRCQYCFVKRGFEEKFIQEVSSKLGYCLDIYTKDDILKNKLFGYSQTDRFLDRIGDFVLLAKEDYIITDGYDKINIGVHGGISDWEILVPLIKF